MLKKWLNGIITLFFHKLLVDTEITINIFVSSFLPSSIAQKALQA